jgi:membrane-bound lytic murein transglycosylase D
MSLHDKKIKVLILIIFAINFLFIDTVSLCSDKTNDIEENEELTVTIKEEEIDNSLKKTIMEATDNLNVAINGCIQSDYVNVSENYHKFLEKINSIKLKPEEIEFLLTDCENMLRKIKNINNIDTNRNHMNRDKTFEISMAYDQEVLDKWMKIYTTGKPKQNIKTALERSGKYRDMILEILKEYNLPEELLYLPIVESLFNNNTVSTAKAVGLWQIMAHRGQALGLHINYWIDERKDPVKATRAAAKYLKELFILLNDWHLALSAYNRGEYGLIRDMKFSNSSSLTEMKQRNATPKETQNYIPQFIVSVKIASDPEKYGFTDLHYQEPLKYDVVIINKVIDLKIVAKCANTTVEIIRELNPAILAWCTPHGYKNFELHLPSGTKDVFLENIAKEKDLNPSPGFIKYKVKKGEYLEKIAKNFKTTVKAIKEDNPKLKKQKYIQPNQIIVIRPGRKYYNK